MTTPLTIRPTPCAACPYRVNAPSGIWAREEYLKLPDYDRTTGEQPIGVFLCHDGDRETTLCRGWLECHLTNNPCGHELLSLRLATSLGNAIELPIQPSGVELHQSGAAACAAGLRQLKRPGKLARKMVDKLRRKHSL